MRYEWDERKRAANLEKHGLDFVDAHLVMLVYAMRGGTVRCISLRPASKSERKVFREISDREKD